MSDVKRIAFADGAQVTVNSEDGILVVVDSDKDPAYVTLDGVGAMALAEALTAWVVENLGEENAEAIAKVNASLEALATMKRAKAEAGL